MRLKKYNIGGAFTGVTGPSDPQPGDVYRRDIDPSQEYMNEKALERREFEGTLSGQHGHRPAPQWGIQRGAANPYYIKQANEYYRDVYSDPEVIAKIAEQIDMPYPDSFLQQVGDYMYDNDILKSLLVSYNFEPTALRDHFLDNLEYEYPNAGVFDNPRTKEEADQKRQALAELLARRRRDIMSSNADRFYAQNFPRTGGYVFPEASSAGTERNPYWMGMSTVQDRGVEVLQVDDGPIEKQRNLTTHEMSHAQDRGGLYLTDGFIDYVTNNRKSEEEAALNKQDGMDYYYLTRPTEVMARLNDVREKMYRKGGYRRFEDVPSDLMAELEADGALQQLKSVFGDEQVKEMINNYYANGGRVVKYRVS